MSKHRIKEITPYVLEHHDMKAKDLADILGVSKSQIYHAKKKLGIVYHRTPNEQNDFTSALMEHRDISCKELANMLGVKDYQVANARRKIGIGRGKGHARGIPKENRKPIGTRKVEKSHNRLRVMIKISDTMDYHKDWVPEHKYIWEQANGKLEKGMQIVHLDGNTLNNDISNLYAITKQVAIRLNQNGWYFKDDPDKQLAAVKCAELTATLSEQGFDFREYYHQLRKLGVNS